MERKIKNVSVKLIPSGEGKVQPSYLDYTPTREMDNTEIISMVFWLIEWRLKFLASPENYFLNIEIVRNGINKPDRVDKKMGYWKIWFTHLKNGHETKPFHMESKIDASEAKTELKVLKRAKGLSRLADFPDTWKINIEKVAKVHYNGKWISREEYEKIEEKSGKVVLNIKVKNGVKQIRRASLNHNTNYTRLREYMETEKLRKYSLAS